MTFRCPIDGRELESGQPCPDHGVAFTEYKPGTERIVARTTKLSRTTDSADAPKPRRRGKSK